VHEYIIDLETSIKNRGEDAIGKFKASPFFPSNNIVMTGIKVRGVSTNINTTVLDTKWLDSAWLLIGQNIKFDLLYLLIHEYDAMMKFFRRGGRIFDVQLAEFILTGQLDQYANLDAMSTKYGGTVKPDIIKEYWDNNIDTEDIPKEQLSDYLKGDVLNTEIVFNEQMKLIYTKGLTNLITMEMEALLATTFMEFNGMQFDKKTAQALANDHSLLLELSKLKVVGMFPEIENINTGSDAHVSALLFGGNIKYKEPRPVLNEDGTEYLYKSGKKKGQVKTKITEVDQQVNEFKLIPNPDWETSKKGVYSVSEANLKCLKKQYSRSEKLVEFLDVILSIRKINKELNTYYIGYGKLVWPDGRIHGKIGHTGTITGRNNSSGPNLMNLVR
jgi:DNA polymerase I-like protein with 3'-5' exonuclease and polymerase domains